MFLHYLGILSHQNRTHNAVFQSESIQCGSWKTRTADDGAVRSCCCVFCTVRTRWLFGHVETVSEPAGENRARYLHTTRIYSQLQVTRSDNLSFFTGFDVGSVSLGLDLTFAIWKSDRGPAWASCFRRCSHVSHSLHSAQHSWPSSETWHYLSFGSECSVSLIMKLMCTLICKHVFKCKCSRCHLKKQPWIIRHGTKMCDIYLHTASSEACVYLRSCE